MKVFNLTLCNSLAGIKNKSASNSSSSIFKMALNLLVLFFSINTFGQSNHTVIFTNTPSDFNALEKYVASSGSTDFYITFDEANVYIGAFKSFGNFAGTDNLSIYLDTDPNEVPTTGNGNSTGVSYNGVTATLPFRADFNVYAEEFIQQANIYSGGWVTATGPAYTASNTSREVKIPFSVLGNPKALNLTLWIGNAGGIYSNAPGANVPSSATPSLVNFFGTFGILNGVQGNVNPVNIISAPAKDYILATANIAAGTYANIDIAADLNLSGDVNLAPGAVININSGNTFTVGASRKINNSLQTNNTKSTQINVKGNFILQGKASCSQFDVANGAAYTHDALGSTANGLASDWPGTDVRTYGSNSTVTIEQWAQNTATAPIGIPAPTSGGWGNVTFAVTQNYIFPWHQKGAFNEVAGNLILNDVGSTNKNSNYLSFNNNSPANTTMNIGGNFEMNAGGENGIFFFLTPGASITSTLNLGGDFIANGGYIKFGYQLGKVIINYWGSYLQTGSSIRAETTGGCTINYLGTNKTIEATGGNFDTRNITWIIAKDAVIDLKSDLRFYGDEVWKPSNCNIIIDGILNCNGYNIIDWFQFLWVNNTGNTHFTLSQGATLGLGNVVGITIAATRSGNIQTKYRSFSTEANYIYNGTNTQITGAGLPGTVNSLTIKNPTNVSLTNDVQITSYHEIEQGIFNLGDKNVTLHSDANVTANFYKLGSSAGINYGTGQYIVERFINTGTGVGQHPKSWLLLSAPASGNSVRDTWQEGGSTTISGYGTWITDPAGTANGFDGFTYQPSIKVFNAATNTLESIGSANNPINNQFGYFLFVRGDRQSRTVPSPLTTTTLRVKGKLITGTQPPVAVPANSFQSIGNPYASVVDFKELYAKSNNIDKSFYVWDPSASGTYGFGKYQTVSGTTGYIAVPGGSTIYLPNTDYSHIQSGQAFMVKNSTGSAGDVAFTEDCKAPANSVLISRQKNPGGIFQLLFSNLYNSSGLLIDGNALSFDNAYSNSIGKEDAKKFNIQGENFGIIRDHISLAVEGRQPLRETDTIFYNSMNLRGQDYNMVFIPQKIKTHLKAFLIDRFLKTENQVSMRDSTRYSFTVNADSGSDSPDRFMLVFRETRPKEVTKITVGAKEKNGSIKLYWRVQHQKNIEKYEIMRSGDSVHFSAIGIVMASSETTDHYQFTDNAPKQNINYYQIKYIDKNEVALLSEIVKVETPATNHFTIFPNPIQDNTINVKAKKISEGKYKINVINSLGRIVLSTKTELSGNTHISIKLPNRLLRGIYNLEIIKPDGTVVNLKFKN